MQGGPLGRVGRLMAGMLVLAVLLMPAARFASAPGGQPDRHAHAEVASRADAGQLAAVIVTPSDAMQPGAQRDGEPPCRGHEHGNGLDCCGMGGCIDHAGWIPAATEATGPHRASTALYRAGIAPMPRGLDTPPALHPPRPTT